MSDIKKLPFVITLCEGAHTAFDKATLLIREGYRFSADAPVQIFPDGVASIVLTIGTPADPAVAAAEEAKAEALVLEEIEFERRVRIAAKELVEQQAKAEKEKQVAAMRAEQQKQLAKLQAELAK